MKTIFPIARYDLAWQFNSFDYYHWQAWAHAQGAQRVIFDCSGWKKSIFEHEVVLKRFESIIRPGPQFLGMTGEVEHRDTGRGGCRERFKLPQWVAWVRENGGPNSFKRMRTVREADDPPRFTVTIRDQGRKSQYRNSNREAWLAFADEVGALVIEDYDVVPIALEDRMALYAAAEMNFGVCSGPLVFCTMSEYPCMSFDWGKGPQMDVLRLSGLRPGENMPWCRPKDQWTLWEPDTLDNIRAAFKRWKSGAKW